jgi:hypothetical protein
MVSGSGVLYSYGEAPNYQGQQILLDIDAGRPFVYNIQPTAQTVVQGSLHVQRSFAVAAGRFPSVAVVLDVLCNEEPHMQVSFDISHMIPSSDGVEGRVNFRYDPRLPVAQL